MGDVWTVMWREWRELAVWDGAWITALSLGAFAGLIGVLLPWLVGAAWVEAPWVLLFWIWMPLFLVTTVTADTFAGERERHTLETLLATRLPDRAILTGKIGAAVVWVWGATMACLPLGLLTLNLTHRSGGLIVYGPGLAAGITGVTLLAALLGAALGVLVSLRVASVRQAQQVLAVTVLVLFLVPAMAIKALPFAWTGRVVETVVLGDPAHVALAAVGVLGALDALFLLLAELRFRRRRLMLD